MEVLAPSSGMIYGSLYTVVSRNKYRTPLVYRWVWACVRGTPHFKYSHNHVRLYGWVDNGGGGRKRGGWEQGRA